MSDESVMAVLVDGVGNLREIKMANPYHILRVPMPRDPSTDFNALAAAPSPNVFSSAHWEATFQRVGRLPDDRVVYGFAFPEGTPQFSLWSISVSWVESLPRDGVAVVARHVDQQIEALNTQRPVVRLYDHIQHDHATYQFNRLVMGVGRKAG